MEQRFGKFVIAQLGLKYIKELVDLNSSITVKGERPNEVLELGSDCIV